MEKLCIDFVRICIEVDVAVELIKEFSWNYLEGNVYDILVEYDLEPKQCHRCKIFGHLFLVY